MLSILLICLTGTLLALSVAEGYDIAPAGVPMLTLGADASGSGALGAPKDWMVGRSFVLDACPGFRGVAIFCVGHANINTTYL